MPTPFRRNSASCVPNGDVRCAPAPAIANFDEQGRLIWLSGVVADITERKRAEERQILLAEEVAIARVTSSPSYSQLCD